MGERTPARPSGPVAPGLPGAWGCAEAPGALSNQRPLQMHQFIFLRLGGAGPEHGPSRGLFLTCSPAPSQASGQSRGRWPLGSRVLRGTWVKVVQCQGRAVSPPPHPRYPPLGAWGVGQGGGCRAEAGGFRACCLTP